MKPLLRLSQPPAVALDNCRLKPELAKLRHFQRHLAGLAVQLSLVVPGSGVLACLGSLVALRPAQPVGSLQHRVERLLD
jgi:hypothetical protein